MTEDYPKPKPFHDAVVLIDVPNEPNPDLIRQLDEVCDPVETEMKTKKTKKKSIKPKKIEPAVLQEDQEDVLEEVLEIGTAIAGIASLIGGDDNSGGSDFGFGGGDTGGGGSSDDW